MTAEITPRLQRVRKAVFLVMWLCLGLALVVPATVILLAVGGVIGQSPYYPAPEAWPTIFASAVLAVAGLNALYWWRAGWHLWSRERLAAAGVVILLGLVSIFAVMVLVMVGYVIYFQFPVE